jgi:hypothetical protein
LKPAQVKSLPDPISKKSITHTKKRTGGVAQGVDPEFKPQYHTHTQKVMQGRKKERKKERRKKRKMKGHQSQDLNPGLTPLP